jgi:hypothetical protein
MTGPATPGDLSNPDELASITARFPGFLLWRETIHGRTRYVARSVRLDTRPHTVITDDLAELRSALAVRQP